MSLKIQYQKRCGACKISKCFDWDEETDNPYYDKLPWMDLDSICALCKDSFEKYCWTYHVLDEHNTEQNEIRT